MGDEYRCARCGAESPTGAVYCGRCGWALGTEEKGATEIVGGVSVEDGAAGDVLPAARFHLGALMKLGVIVAVLFMAPRREQLLAVVGVWVLLSIIHLLPFALLARLWRLHVERIAIGDGSSVMAFRIHHTTLSLGWFIFSG